MNKLICCFLLSGTSLLALPTGGELIQGQASMLSSLNLLEVNANGKAILHWDQFNIAAHEAVHFSQSQGNQAILNRVTSGSMSEILGQLRANCPIYLINPSGVLIGNSACIETAGFLASTADLSNEAFWQGAELLFQGFGEGEILNLGTIRALGGDVFLVARKIGNQGRIEALNGMAILATSEILLNPDTKEHVFIRVDEASHREEGIQNSGALQALQVELHTCSPYERAINHTGSIEAVKGVEQNGRIYLVAEKGETVVDGSLTAEAGEIRVLGEKVELLDQARIDVSGSYGGTILIGGDYQGASSDVMNAQETLVAPGAEIHADALLQGDGGKVIVWSDRATSYKGTISACGGPSGGDGGFVEVSAKSNNWFYCGTVSTQAFAGGKSGILLLDPSNITITAGVIGGSSPAFTNPYNPVVASATLTNGDLQNALATNNVIVSTSNGVGGSGTVTFAANVTWATDKQLSISATQNIIVNSGVTVSNTFSGTPTNNPLINFTANAGVLSGNFSGVLLQGGAVSSVDGDISMTATGGNQDNNKGIYLQGGASIISTGKGAISLIGTAQSTGSGANKEGIRVGNVGIGTIQVTNGNLYLEGHGGSGNLSQGIEINGGGIVRSTGAGNITLVATSASTASLSSGAIFIGDGISGALETTGTGNIDIQAISGATGSGATGIAMGLATSHISTISGNITIVAQASLLGTSDAVGVSVGPGQITTNSGIITISAIGGGGSSTGATTSRGITLSGSSSRVQATGTGSIAITATGGGAGSGTNNSNQGILLSGGGKILTANGNLTCRGIGGKGTSATEGVLITGVGSSISATGGSVVVTGAGGGTGTTASGISLAAGGQITNTSTGTITLNGTASLAGTTVSSGILVSGISSAITSALGNITLTATGNGNGAANTGLSVTSAGNISSTSGAIQTAVPHAEGGVGTDSCYGIFVNGIGSLITSATGSINLTGTARGTTTSNQGIFLGNGGAITTTNNAPITLMGTGSASGTSSNEGIFMTGASTAVSTVTGAIQMTGVAGGGSTNGIVVDTTAAVVSTTAGLVTLTSTNNNVSVQNNGSVKTQGVGGPGVNDITITSNGLTVTGGAVAAGSVVSTVNGNVTVASTGPVSVTGSTSASSFGQITVGNAANTVAIQTTSLSLTAGSGSGALAEISTVGGLLSIDGSGAIVLTGGSNTNTQAQIITRTSVLTTATDAIRIGQLSLTKPTSITLLGNTGATSQALIASDQGGNIVSTITGLYTITGGTGITDARAGVYAGFTGGTSTGSGNITLTGAGYSLTGGASGTGYNSAEILAPSGGGLISLTSNGSPMSLLAGGATTSDARIESLASGNLIISNISTFTATGSSGSSARAIVATGQGGDITVAGSGIYTITGGSSGTDSRAGIFSGLASGNGNISVTGDAMSITGGSGTGTGIAGLFSGFASGSGNISVTAASLSLAGGSNTGTNDAQIAAPAGGGSVTVTAAGAVTLNGGTATNQNSFIQTLGNSGANPISLTCGSLNLSGSTTVGAANAAAEIKTVLGNIGITASNDIALAGGTADGTNALIQCTTQGAITLSSINAAIQGGTGLGISGIVTQAGDISITCSQNLQCAAPNAGAFAAIQTFGSNLTATVNGSINLSGSTLISTPAPTGDILLIAGKNISIGTSVQISNHGTSNSSLKLVVDNNYPVSPQMGPGQFTLDAGATISSAGSPPVKIYTSRRSQNTINSPINGEVFVPGPFGVDTPTEQWSSYYPTDPPAPAFTIYYKEPQSITPFTPVIYNNIGVNLIQLARVLPIIQPVLDVTRGHYHFELCDEANGLPCDPTFSPYGSFIFEDDVYWIGVGF